MRPGRPKLQRLFGYALIAGLWTLALTLVAVFGAAYVIYADFKAPGHSHLTAGTRLASLADVIYGRFRSPWGIQPDDELGYVPRVGPSRVRSPEYDVTMTYVAAGGRLQPPAPAGHDGRVVLLGDSYTAGLGVGDDETFSALLQTRHGHATVNTGVISYSAARELWRARRLGVLAAADVVVLQFCGNDIPENRRFVTQPFAPLGTDGGGAWTVSRRQEYLELSYLNVLRACVQQTHFLIKHYGLRGAARTFLFTPRPELGMPVERSPDETAEGAAADFLAVLDHFPELAGKPIIVIEFNPRGSRTGFLLALRASTRHRPNLDVLDLQLLTADFFPFDGHLNARGHAHVAAQLHAAIARALRQPRDATPH